MTDGRHCFSWWDYWYPQARRVHGSGGRPLYVDAQEMEIRPAGSGAITVCVSRRVSRQPSLGTEYAGVWPGLVIAEADDALTFLCLELPIVRYVAIVIAGHKAVVLAAIMNCLSVNS